MIKFKYAKKYKNNENFYKYRLIFEKTIRDILAKYFNDTIKINIQIEAKENKYFKNGTLATTFHEQNLIRYDFDKFIDYQLSRELYPDDLDFIEDKENQIYNAIIHEIQHLYNRVEYSQNFLQINELEVSDFVRVGIDCILDEYLAMSKALNHYYLNLCGVDSILDKFSQLDDVRDNPNYEVKLNFYMDLLYIIPAAFSDIKATENIDDQIRIFDNYERSNPDSIIVAILLIGMLLLDINNNNVNEFVEKCKIHLLTIIKELGVDESLI